MKRFITDSAVVPSTPVGQGWEAVSESFDRFCLAAGIEALGAMMEGDRIWTLASRWRSPLPPSACPTTMTKFVECSVAEVPTAISRYCWRKGAN